MSRKLKLKEANELEKNYGERKADPGMLAILRENYMRPLTPDLGQSLLNYRLINLEQIFLQILSLTLVLFVAITQYSMKQPRRDSR